MFRKRSKATKKRPSLVRCSEVKPIDTFYSFCRTSKFNCYLFWATLGGWGSLRRFIHFYLRKKIRNQNSVERIRVILLFKYCLKNGSNFPMNGDMLDEVFRSKKYVRWSIQIEKIGSAYISIDIYHILFRWWFHLGSAYLHIDIKSWP